MTISATQLTITCKHCGMPELHWEKISYRVNGSRHWRLHFTSPTTGETTLHSCIASRGKGASPKWYAKQEARDGITTTADATTEVSSVIEDAMEEAIATVIERDFNRNVIVQNGIWWDS